MNRSFWLAMTLTIALAYSAALAAEDQLRRADSAVVDGANPVSFRDRYTTGMIGVGDWFVELSGLQWVSTDGIITGLAFGPGRAELAYATTDGGAESALWVVPIPAFDENGLWLQGPIESPARLLWRASEGRTLGAPLWWAPNGSNLALLSRAGDTADLVSVDYVSGAAAILARDVNVSDLAWEPAARRLAYVTESDGSSKVWLQTLPPGEPRQIGEGGVNLRWSLDGSLTWLRADPDTTWSEVLWDPRSEQTRTIGSSPARTPAALWSPDGLLCADLAPTGNAGENQLVIYPSSSTAGDPIALPGARPQRLLGWSPDSRMVLLLVAGNQLLLVGALPPTSQLSRTLIAEDAGGNIGDVLKLRASLLAYPLVDPAAGPPAWSSPGDLLAYTVAGEDVYRHLFGRVWPNAPYGHLAVQTLKRRYVEPAPLTDYTEAQQVLGNVKNVALALQMYLADSNDILPPVGDTDLLLPILDPYVRTRDIFMRPGTEDDLVVQYVLAPGTSFADLPDTATTPAVIADYSPDFFAIGFCDGHAELLQKTDENAAVLDDWWAELDALRAEDPNALPPPFPPDD